MDDETKADPVKRLVGVLKKQEKIGTGAHYFENLLADDARLTPRRELDRICTYGTSGVRIGNIYIKNTD